MQFLLALVGGFALGQIGRVVAAVGLDGLAAQLPDAGADGVQKIAVMADDQHRAAVGLEVIFQPFHGFQVQVVGRLVQDQQIRTLQQQTGQAQTSLLTAGKDARQFDPGIHREAHTVEHLFDLGVHIISVHGIHDGGAVGDFLGQGCVMRVCSQAALQVVHLLHGVQRRGEGQFHRGVNVQRGGQARVLLQIATGHAGAKGSIACIGQALAAQDAQQRGFAGAVCANDADAVAALDPGVDVLQNFMFAKAFAQVLQFQQHGGVSSPLLCPLLRYFAFFHNAAAALGERQRHTA